MEKFAGRSGRTHQRLASEIEDVEYCLDLAFNMGVRLGFLSEFVAGG